MKTSDLERLIARHGPELARWPEADRSAADILLARSEAARAILDSDVRLAALLARSDAAATGTAPSGSASSDPHDALLASILAAAHRTHQLPAEAVPVSQPRGALRDALAGFGPLRHVWGQGVAFAAVAGLGFVVGFTQPQPADPAGTEIAFADDETIDFAALAFGTGGTGFDSYFDITDTP